MQSSQPCSWYYQDTVKTLSRYYRLVCNHGIDIILISLTSWGLTLTQCVQQPSNNSWSTQLSCAGQPLWHSVPHHPKQEHKRGIEPRPISLSPEPWKPIRASYFVTWLKRANQSTVYYHLTPNIQSEPEHTLWICCPVLDQYQRGTDPAV